MSLKGMYAYAEKVSQGKFHGTIEERGGKLEFKGTVATEAEKNEIWNAIKTIPTWQTDINADIRVTGGPAASPAARRGETRRKCAPATGSEDLHGQGRRYPRQHRQGASRERRRIHEDLRPEQGSAVRPGQDQAGTGIAASVTRRAHRSSPGTIGARKPARPGIADSAPRAVGGGTRRDRRSAGPVDRRARRSFSGLSLSS